MEARRCRVWWPDEISLREPTSGLLLFGWFIDSVSSIDIVVAAAYLPCHVSDYLRPSNLQEMLHSINGKMPMLLESTKFCLLGHCATRKEVRMECSYKNNPPSEDIHECLVKPNSRGETSYDSVSQCVQESSTSAGNFVRWNCGCVNLDSIEPWGQSLIRDNIWVQMLLKPQRLLSKETRWVPEFHHIHLNGHIASSYDVHLIMYELPTFGRHHFALNSLYVSKQLEITFTRPCWVDELHEKPMLPYLDKVVLAINCASAAKLCIQRSLSTSIPVNHFHCKSILASMLWHTAALFVAMISTVVYIIIRFFYSLQRYGSQIFLMSVHKIFQHTWKNVHIRSSQFMYWPFFLHGYGFRTQLNVEYAHRAALQKHLMWSSFAMDILLGMIIGVALLANLDVICFGITFLSSYITDNLLRSGCVWLMGVPAGFKLNIELAEVLGMISLNAIQVFSTFWFFMASSLRFRPWHHYGACSDRTYLEPFKSMRGKGRVTIQFGCCYNYDTDKKGNPPGIIRDEDVDPLPPLFKMMIKRMVTWKVLPHTCIPNSCIVNIYDEDDCIPPHIDHHDFVRPFSTVSFLSECKILFGTKLTPLGPGDFVGPVAIPLPVGSVLVLNGNGADVARHCVPAVPTKRISITFRKMDESKLPYNFKRDPEMQNLRPHVLGKSPSQRVPIAGSPVQQQAHQASTSQVPLPSTSGSFQSQADTPEVADNKSVSPYKMGEQDFPSLVSSSSVLPKHSPSQLAPSAASPVEEQGHNASPVQVPVLRTTGSFLRVAALPVQQQRYHAPSSQAPRSRTNGSLQGQKGTPEAAHQKSGSSFEVNEQDFPSLGSGSSSSGSGRRVTRSTKNIYTLPGSRP